MTSPAVLRLCCLLGATQAVLLPTGLDLLPSLVVPTHSHPSTHSQERPLLPHCHHHWVQHSLVRLFTLLHPPPLFLVSFHRV